MDMKAESIARRMKKVVNIIVDFALLTFILLLVFAGHAQ